MKNYTTSNHCMTKRKNIDEYRKNESFTFLSSSSYSVTFFVQNNVNPFFNNERRMFRYARFDMETTLILYNVQTAWMAMKIFSMENTFIDQLPIDDNFTLNDDMPGFYDYRDQLIVTTITIQK